MVAGPWYHPCDCRVLSRLRGISVPYPLVERGHTMTSAFLGAAWVLKGVLRYIVWPVLLIATLGPIGLLVWLFIH